jgi:hypothetical protein
MCFGYGELFGLALSGAQEEDLSWSTGVLEYWKIGKLEYWAKQEIPTFLFFAFPNTPIFHHSIIPKDNEKTGSTLCRDESQPNLVGWECILLWV